MYQTTYPVTLPMRILVLGLWWMSYHSIGNVVPCDNPFARKPRADHVVAGIGRHHIRLRQQCARLEVSRRHIRDESQLSPASLEMSVCTARSVDDFILFYFCE